LTTKIGFNKYTSLIERLAEIIHLARATVVRQINEKQADELEGRHLDLRRERVLYV
jgi:hypothetical protein